MIAYIRRDSPDAAARMLDLLLDSAASLRTLSHRGRIVAELREPSIREIFAYSYRVLYHVTKEEVRILAILHGARDSSRRLRPPEAE